MQSNICSNRDVSIDNFKIVFSVFVVGIHAGFASEVSNLVSQFFVDGVFRVGVVYFFLVAGFYCGEKIYKNGCRSFFHRYVFLAIFWSAIYSPFVFYKFYGDWAKLLINVFFGYHHLWFVFALAFVVFAFDFVSRRFSYRSLLFVSVVLYVSGCVIQYFSLFASFKVPHFLYRNFLFYGFPAFFWGYAVFRGRLEWALGFSKYLLILFLLEILVVVKFGDLSRGVDMLFFLLPFSVSVLVLILKFQQSRVFFDKKFSSFLYFVHPAVISIFSVFGLVSGTFLFALTVFVVVVLFFGIKKYSPSFLRFV